MKKESKMNARSYFYTMLFALPTLSLGNFVGNTDELISGIARILSLIILVFVIVWTVHRLRNAGKSGWWAFALIPPATILMIIYGLFAPSSPEHTERHLYIYGIRAKGLWRIMAITLISIFLLYMILLYVTFLSDGL
jgi:uncharacterized membrane protein YhaH (DUF805 family)